MRSRAEYDSGWDLDEWAEPLTANAKVATVLLPIQTSSDSEEIEGAAYEALLNKVHQNLFSFLGAREVCGDAVWARHQDSHRQKAGCQLSLALVHPPLKEDQWRAPRTVTWLATRQPIRRCVTWQRTPASQPGILGWSRDNLSSDQSEGTAMSHSGPMGGPSPWLWWQNQQEAFFWWFEGVDQSVVDILKSFVISWDYSVFFPTPFVNLFVPQSVLCKRRHYVVAFSV
jgi:hypothetical protein